MMNPGFVERRKRVRTNGVRRLNSPVERRNSQVYTLRMNYCQLLIRMLLVSRQWQFRSAPTSSRNRHTEMKGKDKPIARYQAGIRASGTHRRSQVLGWFV